MKDEPIQFYPDDFKGLESLKDFPIDNSTKTVYIDTPEGWVCPVKGCPTPFLHTHGTYDSLKA